ncbi:hypothetical protein AAFF_G00049140 [Aldrovandia affinis]|uniref:Uncharacterized protein n=1 Tax=Aldrovandia affinis TaxID=143900 RepID=A0AAD7WFK1_9TELE|nr:hypothetical protein AAFF_G00049140 [Aldrovandia affinis]
MLSKHKRLKDIAGMKDQPGNFSQPGGKGGKLQRAASAGVSLGELAALARQGPAAVSLALVHKGQEAQSGGCARAFSLFLTVLCYCSLSLWHRYGTDNEERPRQ